MTEAIHDQAAAKLTDLAEMIDNALPEGTHFALVIATPVDDDNAETAHITTMDTGTMVSLLTAHVRALLTSQGQKFEAPKSGRA